VIKIKRIEAGMITKKKTPRPSIFSMDEPALKIISKFSKSRNALGGLPLVANPPTFAGFVNPARTMGFTEIYLPKE
jgi:hypothetical protein